jgi:hypothetical protein
MIPLSIMLFTACRNTATNSAVASPSPSPANATNQAAEAESEFQLLGDLDNSVRAEARHTASEFVASKLPTWKIKGLSSQIYQDNVVSVAVDIEKEGRGGILNIAVRRFFPRFR